MPHGAIPFPFGDCRICNDKATGVHYGVATCEGCKGFYKRSIPKGDKYRCYFGGKCIISPENRNRCKACRFRKCLEQGMAVEAVKMGRIPKVEKERALEQAASDRKEGGDVQGGGDGAAPQPSCSTSQAHGNVAGKTFPKKRSSGHMTDANAGGEASRTERVKDSLGESPVKRSLTDVSCSGAASVSSFTGENSQHGLEGHRGPFAHGRHEQSHIPVYSHSSVAPHPQLSPVPQGGAGFSHHGGHSSHGGGKSGAGMTGGAGSSVAADQGINSNHIGSPTSGQHYNRGSCSPEINRHTNFQASDKRTLSPNSDCALVTVKIENDTDSCQMAGNSNSSHGGGAQRSAYSPGVIQMLFSQVLQSENTDQKEKVLKKLARSCSQEGLSSGLELLQVVVTSDDPSVLPDSVMYGSAGTSETQSASVSSPPESIASYNYGTPNGSSDSRFMAESSAMSAFTETPVSLSASLSHGYSLNSSRNSDAAFGQPVASLGHDFRGSLGSGDRSHGLLPYNSTQNSCEMGHNGHVNTSSSYHQRMPINQSVTTTAAAPSFSHRSVSDVHSGHQPQNLQAHVFQNSSDRHSAQFVENHVSAPQDSFYREDVSFLNNPGDASDFSYSSYNHTPACYSSSINQQPHTVPSVARDNSSDISSASSTPQLSFRSPDLPISSTIDQLSIPSQSSRNYVDLSALYKDDQSREKEEVLSYDGRSSGSSCDNVLVAGPLSEEADVELNDTVRTLENSFHSYFELEKKMSKRDEFLQQKRENANVQVPAPTLEKLWPLLMIAVSELNESIIGFCQTVPGFVELDPVDQEVLLKRAYYDIWMLTSSQFFVDGESYLVLRDGTFYIRSLMEHLIGKENTRTIHVFAEQFNALHLSHVEVAILCCIQLTAPGHDQPDLKNPQAIQKLNSYYLDLLVAVVTHSHPAICSRVLVDIFRLIPLLAEINRLQREIIANFSVDRSPHTEEESVQDSQADVKTEPPAVSNGELTDLVAELPDH